MPAAANSMASIIKAVARVRDEAGHIEKDGWNAFHKYKYVSESALSNGIRPLLKKHKLVILQSVAIDPKPTIDDCGVTHLVLEFTLAHEDGAVWPEKFRVFCSGNDRDSKGMHGDKGAYKANTGGYKYFLNRMFMVDTGDDPERDAPKKDSDDADDDRPLPKAEPPRKEGEVKLATPKQLKYLTAISYEHAEKLTGIGNHDKLAGSIRKAAMTSLGFNEAKAITLAAAKGPMVRAIQATMLDVQRGNDHATMPDGAF